MLGRAILGRGAPPASRARVGAMTAKSCVLLPRHPDEVTTVVPRRRGNEAISMFHLPKARAIDTQVGAQAQISSVPVPPADTCRQSGGEAPASRTSVRPRLPEARPVRSGQGP